MPGYWLRSTADAFVRRRRVAPGPARKTGTEQFLDQLMAGEKARREGRPVPEADWSLLPSTMQEAFEENGYTPAEASALVSGESIPARGSTRADRSATSG